MVPLKLAELNISFKDINQNVQNVDFTLGENDLEELINELEDALAIADKVETKWMCIYSFCHKISYFYFESSCENILTWEFFQQ